MPFCDLEFSILNRDFRVGDDSHHRSGTSGHPLPRAERPSPDGEKGKGEVLRARGALTC